MARGSVENVDYFEKILLITSENYDIHLNFPGGLALMALPQG